MSGRLCGARLGTQLPCDFVRLDLGEDGRDRFGACTDVGQLDDRLLCELCFSFPTRAQLTLGGITNPSTFFLSKVFIACCPLASQLPAFPPILSCSLAVTSLAADLGVMSTWNRAWRVVEYWVVASVADWNQHMPKRSCDVRPSSRGQHRSDTAPAWTSSEVGP